ncbi:unnamed protein product [Merluccius merluccius]
MLKPQGFKWFWCLWVSVLVQGSNLREHGDLQQRPLCHPGSYCPVGTSHRIVLCPQGSYGPSDGAVSIEGCLSCPSHHYCPRAGLAAPLPCGPDAHQPLPGQISCICLGEGQSFQVCPSAEDYQGYDGELGVCTCRAPSGGPSCGSLCRRGSGAKLKLQCSADGDLELAWRYNAHQASALSARLLERAFKRWDSQGTLLCHRPNSTYSVHAVETTDGDSGTTWEGHQDKNTSDEGGASNSIGLGGGRGHFNDEPGISGVMNPTACLQLSDVLLFTVNTQHYPQYDISCFVSTVGQRRSQSRQVACAETADEFWDYEKQVDLEAFSTNTFYHLLLKQSLSVTSRLGQLTSEVKELYQGVLEKLSLLRPHLPTEERGADGYERLRREVLQQEAQIQKRVHNVFTAHLKECTRLLDKTCHPHLLWEQNPQSAVQRVLSLVVEMGELVSAESKRQGAWGMLGDGTGARLLCPDTGTVLTKEHLIGPAGGSPLGGAVHTDAVTGLLRPVPHCHMLLGGGHIMPVPPDFFVHPHTGRVMPIHGNVAYDPAGSALVCTTDLCRDDNRKCETPLLPFVPYPTSRHSDRPLPCSKLRGLRPGQRLQLGAPMADPVTGVPVPILGVTIHPQSGLVYPLGGLYACPLTGLQQPIQMGSPMLDPRTGDMMLTTGVNLDPVTGVVLPVGGVVLADSFIDPLSGRLARVGGASIRAGQMVAHAGGLQAFLDGKVKVLELLKGLTTEGWKSGGERGHGGLMQLPGCNMCVPALLGLEYPDPMGSGLSVPVLGSQADLLTGYTVPLAGTMEDPSGKGLVPIRIGSLTVDPVTGVLAPVVGARLDVSRKNIVPVTVSNWITTCDHIDTVQVEALQREVCLRSQYWQQQGQKEEKILSGLDMALVHFLGVATQANSDQANWSDSGRCLRERVVELQDDAQCEAQRKVVQVSFLSLLLPPHVVHILTQGDEVEWELQCVWHSQLMWCLDSVEVMVERLHRDQEKAFPHQDTDWDLRQKELSQQFCSRQAELETAMTNLQFWYKDYGLSQHDGPRSCVKEVGLVQQKALPLLEKLRQLLEDKQPTSLYPSTYWQHISGISSQSLREQFKSQSQDSALPASPQTNRDTASSGNPCQEEEWDKLLELSPLFQLLRKVELKLKEQALDTGLLKGEISEQSNRFVDVLDAQWACEGELIPLDVQTLNPREFLAYQHGLFLLKMLHTLKLEAEERLFVRRQRLQSVGGFSLLLLHCLSHVSIGDMSSDSNPAFQRLFFKEEAELQKRHSETSLFARVEELLREKNN